MRIIGTLETVTTPATVNTPAETVIEHTIVEADDYHQGFAAMRRNLPDGTSLIAVRVEH